MDEGSALEKRLMRRFPLELPVKVLASSGEQIETTARTRDVSSHGICFYCDAAIERGSTIEFTVTLPAEVTMTEPLSVRCQGRVVRVESGGPADGTFTIAAAIENYEFVSAPELENFTKCADERLAL